MTRQSAYQKQPREFAWVADRGDSAFAEVIPKSSIDFRPTSQIPNTPNPQVWTEAQIDELRRLVSVGLTDAKIASIMGKKVLAVTRKRTRLGLVSEYGRSRLWSKSEAQILKRSLAAGMSYRQIAPLLGKSSEAIRMAAHNRNLVSKYIAPDRWSISESRKLRKLVNLGLSITDITKRMNGRSYEAVRRQALNKIKSAG